jgi:hypothetical protein
MEAEALIDPDVPGFVTTVAELPPKALEPNRFI